MRNSVGRADLLICGVIELMILYMGFSALHSVLFSFFPVVLNINFQFLTRKIAIFDKIDCCYLFAHTGVMQLFSEARVSLMADVHTF